jgi:hypothetical protein
LVVIAVAAIFFSKQYQKFVQMLRPQQNSGVGLHPTDVLFLERMIAKKGI